MASVRFYGSFLHVLDQKNRICLPAQYRAELENTFWARYSSDPVPHIRCMNQSEYDLQLSRQLIRFQHYENSEMTQTAFTASSYQVQLDAQGRITLPTELKESAGIGESAYLVGSGGFIRILSVENRNTMMSLYEQEHAQALSTERAMQENARKVAQNSMPAGFPNAVPYPMSNMNMPNYEDKPPMSNMMPTTPMPAYAPMPMGMPYYGYGYYPGMMPMQQMPESNKEG